MAKHMSIETTGSQFLALPDVEKDRLYAELDALTPTQLRARSRPLNAKERAEWREIKQQLGRGRPRLGAGVEKVSVSVEKTLLAKADTLGKKNHLNRSQVVAKALAMLLAA